jgi:hypothetical protein
MRIEFLGYQSPDIISLDDVCLGTGSTCGVPAAVSTASVPTLTTWGILILAGGLLLLGSKIARRRQNA